MASLFKTLKDEQIQCLACNHFCTIAKGNTGICGVRQNIEGKLSLWVYGKPVSTHVDPIEKKPLFHFYPQSKAFSLGTLGCNFRCSFCQNWDISQGSKLSIDQYCQEWSASKIVNYCLENDITSIAYTYNEPTIFAEYAYDVMKHASTAGLKNIFVSNGYFSRNTMDLVAPYLDAINIDLKSFNETFYRKLCGAKLKPILENIRNIYERDIWLELTTLVIPDENDSSKELTEIAHFIGSIDKEIPWHISRFFPAYKMNLHSNTPMETLYRAYNIGKDQGLRHVYIGNIIDREYESSYCFKCKVKLIERQGYSINLTNMFEKGQCLNCGTKNKGIW